MLRAWGAVTKKPDKHKAESTKHGAQSMSTKHEAQSMSMKQRQKIWALHKETTSRENDPGYTVVTPLARSALQRRKG
jgi:hypothetical protein